MDMETFRHSPSTGWTVDRFPGLDGPNTLVLLFGAGHYLESAGAIEELVHAYPESTVVGCSTSGEIFDGGLWDDSLAVAVVRFEHTGLEAEWAPVSEPGQSRQAGVALAGSLNKPGLAGVLVLSDGLTVNGSELVQGLNEVLPESVVVTGGLAGDGDRFKRTWVLRGGKPVSGYVSAVGFYGDRVQIGHGSKGGWDIFGPERVVTKSQNNILYELDGRPALQLYKQYLGERAAGLPATALLFPLALRSSASDPNQVVRTVLAVDEATQSMTFAGNVPMGHLAQLMRANLDRLIDGASDAALMTRGRAERGSGGQVLSIGISCVGRRLILGERTEDELESALEVLPEGTKQIGFYSYGEISPYASGRCDLHNQTMTLTTLCER